MVSTAAYVERAAARRNPEAQAQVCGIPPGGRWTGRHGEHRQTVSCYYGEGRTDDLRRNPCTRAGAVAALPRVSGRARQRTLLALPRRGPRGDVFAAARR